ncbi:Gfo/Idh/MocA family protein [Pseudonocardia sp. H11422]|uniref:Gfo/Idh/MocA family protein n=1 Tax=Pseudonocardia sp. H11422 TaxID=2835866 RepID=UPI001BDC3FD7|nr:Gfo/Idh/MocA family oxidoreductase [Pseudonocardia sp. H11422]
MTPLRLGVAGLGVAGDVLVPFAERHPDYVVTGGADPSPAAREAFAGSGRQLFASVEEMCGSGAVDVVYVATPTHLHAEHAITALRTGHEVIVEKPMAVSVESAEAMVAAAEEAGRVLIVGHSQSFEAPIRAMRRIVETGELGALRAVNAWYFTDWMFRPRAADELDPEKGGGVPLRQGAHHVDIVRYLGGGRLRSVRGRVGQWDPRRPGDGAYTAYLEFEDGTPATVVYSGYDHFPTTELTFGLGEAGQPMDGYAVARRRLIAATGTAEEDVKRGASAAPSRQRELLRGGGKQPFFGLVVLSCERGDVRVSPDGLLVYRDDRVEEVSLAGQPVGRTAMLTEMADAVLRSSPVTHGGRWGLANLEVCLALVRSSRARREMQLRRQVPLHR